MYFYTSSFTWIEISCVELNYMNETFFLLSTYLTTDFCGWNFHHTYHMDEISPHFCGWNLYHTDYMSKISPLCGIIHWLPNSYVVPIKNAQLNYSAKILKLIYCVSYGEVEMDILMADIIEVICNNNRVPRKNWWDENSNWLKLSKTGEYRNLNVLFRCL